MAEEENTAEEGEQPGGDTPENEGGTPEKEAGADKGEEGGKKSMSMLDDVPADEGLTLPFDAKEKPEGLDDKYWDKEKGTYKTQELYNELKKTEKSVKDLRTKIGKSGHQAPEKAEDYTYEVPESAKDQVKDDDPLVAASKEIAKEVGMSKEQYSTFMAKITDKLVEQAQQMLENPPELSDEEKKEIRDAEYAKIGPNAPAVIRAVESWGKQLKETGMFSEADVAAFKSMVTDASQIRVMNKLRSISGGGSDIPTDATDDGLPSDEEIADMIDKASQAKDPKLQKEVDALLEKRIKAGRPTLLQLRA